MPTQGELPFFLPVINDLFIAVYEIDLHSGD